MENVIYCQNCGHECHCNGDCKQKYDNVGEIICCKHCRHKEKTIKKDELDIDAFNGA